MINNKLIENANKLTLEVHNKLFNETTDEHKIVAQNANSHKKRFDKIIELGDFQGKSILDVGCGLGAFYKYLKDKNLNVDYYGIDINPLMIEKSKEKFPEIANHFTLFDILINDLDKKFDYIIAVGLLNLDFGDNLNMEMTKLLISQLSKHANIGYAINMTSSLSRKPSPESFYYKPDLITSIAMKQCNNFRLDHSYMPHDFTVFCYLDDFYSNK